MAKNSLFLPKHQLFGQDMFFTQKRVAEIGGNTTPSLRGKTLHYRIWSTKDGGGGNVVPLELILHKGGMNSKNVISKFLQFETMAFLHFVATLFDRLLLQDPCWFWSGLWIKRWTLIISFNPIKPVFFGPYNTWGGEGQVCPQAFSFSPEILEGVTCSKMGLQLSSRKSSI